MNSATADVSGVSFRSLLGEAMDDAGMTQTELAAALNVSQAAVSQWLSGRREPSTDVRDRVEHALAARSVTAHTVLTGWRDNEATIPDALWEVAFSPRGRFRLPRHLEWSGTPEQRWRDGSRLDHLLRAYEQVMAVGRAQDIVTWVDPAVLAAHIDELPWSRGLRHPWEVALDAWGLL